MIPNISSTSLTQSATEAVQTALVQAGDASALAQALVIDSPATRELADTELRAVAKQEKALTEQRLSLTRPLDEVKKGIMALFDPAITALQTIQTTYKTKMLAWDKAERARIDEENRKAREAAAAEEKRQRESAEALRKQAEEKAAAGLAAEAEALQAAAHKVASTPPPPAAIVTPVARRKGSSHIAKRWTFEIVSVSDLPRDYLIPDEQKLAKLATALKGDAKVPGVRFFEVESLVTGRG